MPLIVSDPTHYFVFEYPTDCFPFADDGYFESNYPDPYFILDEEAFSGTFNENYSYYDLNGLKRQYYYNSLSEYKLPYKFDSKPIYMDVNELSQFEENEGYYIRAYKHTLVEMTEFDVNSNFLKKLSWYYESDLHNNGSFSLFLDLNSFLWFHYKSYHSDLNQWLDYVLQIINEIEKFIKIPQFTVLQIKKLAKEWIGYRRKELAEFNGQTIEQPPTVEVVEETIVLDTELEMTAHKVVLLHELGVIEHLQRLRKEKNPTMSHTKFAELIGLILGLQGKEIEAVRKGISGYGLKKRDDPKTKNALNKVKSELLKFGIEL